MIHYMDKVFCTRTDCKQFGDGKCDRSLTKQVEWMAKKWWGGKDAPIARFAFASCYEGPGAAPTPVLVEA